MHPSLTFEHSGVMTVPPRLCTEQRIQNARIDLIHQALVPAFYPCDISDAGIWSYGLLSSEHLITTDRLQLEVEPTEWRFGKTAHLLALAESMQTLCISGRIVALGQHGIFDGLSPNVLTLSKIKQDRCLGLECEVGPWYTLDLFLLVKR